MINKNRLATIAIILAIGTLGFKIHSDSQLNLEEVCTEFSDIGWTDIKSGGVRQTNTGAYMVDATFFVYTEGHWSFNVVTSNNSCSEEDNYLIFDNQKILTTNTCEALHDDLQINRIYPKTQKGKEFLFSEIYTNPGKHNVELHTHHNADIDSTNLKCALYKAEKRNAGAI